MDSEIFVYQDTPKFTEDSHVVIVRSGLKDKHELLAFLADELYFPDYFGFNWDAFDEVIDDLSWIKKYKIIIHHEDLPLSNPAERKIYLEALANALTKSDSPKVHDLIISFNNSTKSLIERI